MLAVLISGAASLYFIYFIALALMGSTEPLSGYHFYFPFSDFLVFHGATRAFFEGKLGLIYDTNAFTDFQNALYGAFIHMRMPYNIQLSFRPFFYPPLWLLDLLPFGLLPVEISAIVFLLVTGTLCAIALRLYGLGTGTVLAILTAPPAILLVVTAQNTYLSVALLYGGMALLAKRPVIAGVLLGFLAYKPQLWIMIPLALLVARDWRPLIAMIATVMVLSLASLVLFGADFWLDFIAAAQHASSSEGAAERYAHFKDMMVTITGASMKLGLSAATATALQFVGSIVAVGAVIWAFARYPDRPERLAILVTATFLLSPHILIYDMLLLMPAVALMFLHPSPAGFLPGERIVYGALWLLPLVSTKLSFFGWPIAPLAILLFGLIAVLRLHRTSRVELPIAVVAH